MIIKSHGHISSPIRNFLIYHPHGVIEVRRENDFERVIYQASIITRGLHAMAEDQIGVSVGDRVDGEVDLI